jgi:hypothetical protein
MLSQHQRLAGWLRYTWFTSERRGMKIVLNDKGNNKSRARNLRAIGNRKKRRRRWNRKMKKIR